MSYSFNMQNTLNEDIIISLYYWNDGTHVKSAENINISAGGHQTITPPQDPVVQISVYKKNNSPLLDGKWMNFYATKRNMKVVQKNGVTSIEYTS